MANLRSPAYLPYLRQHQDNPVHWQVWARTGAQVPAGHPAYGKPSDAPATFVCRGGVRALPATTPEARRGLLRHIAKQ